MKAPIFLPPDKMLKMELGEIGIEEGAITRPQLQTFIDEEDQKPSNNDRLLDEKVQEGIKAAKDDILNAMRKT